MEKSKFTNELTVEEVITIDSESVVFETKKGTFRFLVPERVLENHNALGSAITSHEQHRIDGNKNPIETCFIVYYETIKQLKSITVKVLDYKNKTGVLWFNCYDTRGALTYDMVFPYHLSMSFLPQLIHLYNQEKLYFHIYRDGKIYKTLIQDNPFRMDKELENILLKIDMDAIENISDKMSEIHQHLEAYKKDLSLDDLTKIMKNTPSHFIAMK